ncbi:MAG: retropepsin-like aspartic protease [Myxococcota bacterium]
MGYRRRSTAWAGLAALGALGAMLSAPPAAAEPRPQPVRHPEAHDPPAEALLAEIPFQPGSPTTRVMIDLAPEGSRPFVMLLDTGASYSYMTPEMAREIGVSVRRLKRDPYRRKTLLGRDLLFYIDTMSSDTGSRIGASLGLLGANFLSHYVVEIDYPGRVVRFYDPRKYEVPKQVEAPNESVVRLQRTGKRLGVEIEVEGRKVSSLIDTGAPGPVELSGATARELGIDVDSLPHVGRVQLVMGSTELRLYETEGFRMAGFEFPRTPVLVAPHGFFNTGGSTDSALGYDILRHFVLRLDYDESRMWLRRAPPSPMTLYGEDYAAVRESLYLGMTDEEREAAMAAETEARAEAERQATRELEADAERRDRERAERFEREKATRLYVETGHGGWMRVEGYRLRNGPKEGEVWLTFEEMQRIKAFREAAKTPGRPPDAATPGAE